MVDYSRTPEKSYEEVCAQRIAAFKERAKSFGRADEATRRYREAHLALGINVVGSHNSYQETQDMFTSPETKRILDSDDW